MDLVNDLVKCKSCEKIFKMPVLMPCGHSICKHHVDEILLDKNKESTSKIECKICNESHEIPSNGFFRNRLFDTLLEKNINNIELGEEYKSARDKCKLFADLLDRFKKIKNDPEFEINKVISELRNNIDLRREELKQAIDKESFSLIEKLDEFEKECRLKTVLAEPNSNLDEKFKCWQNDLIQWQQILSKFDCSIYSRKKVLEDSSSTLKELHSELVNFNNKLFLNQLNEFKYPSFFDSNKFIDNFITLKFEVKELSKYTDTKVKKVFISPSLNFDGIDWNIQATISNIEDTETKKSDTYFSMYLDANQKSKIRDLKIDFDIYILDQFGTNKHVIKNCIKLFVQPNMAWGCTKLICLKDLIANSNLYNAQNDSCMVQIIVKKFEWV